MTKLTRDMWIELGVEVLRTEGFSALKADKLAKRGGVTRGSFYGYFENLDAYLNQVFEWWLGQSKAVAGELGSLADPQAQLLHLIKTAASSDIALERAMRAWAHGDAKINRRVSEIDSFRINVLRGVIAKITHDNESARSKAKTLYASAIGLAFLPHDQLPITDQDINVLMYGAITLEAHAADGAQSASRSLPDGGELK
ncbi:MAG: TetR/AcrR family transcriptional regulator [Pseudomonadota bacterium]